MRSSGSTHADTPTSKAPVGNDVCKRGLTERFYHNLSSYIALYRHIFQQFTFTLEKQRAFGRNKKTYAGPHAGLHKFFYLERLSDIVYATRHQDAACGIVADKIEERTVERQVYIFIRKSSYIDLG